MPHHTTYIAGVKFRPGAREHLDALPDDELIALEREPDNRFDPNAVKVLHGDVHLGYVPADLAREIGTLIQEGRVSYVLKGAGNKIRIFYDEAFAGPTTGDAA